MFLDYPELGQVLQGFLDGYEGGKLAHDLRFVLAVKDFSQPSQLLLSRASRDHALPR